MRVVLFGQGPLCEAVKAALAGHDIVAVYDSPQPTDVLRAAQAQVGLSAGYRHKLKAEEWECFPDGILNLHTGYLPWNRGAYPNVWPILDGSPAGVTLHRVDEGWDTGPIVAQVQIAVNPWDTAKTLYDKLLRRGAQLVKVTFRRAATEGFGPGTPQDPKAGSFHRKAELESVNLQMSEDELCPEAVIDRLRALTFPGYGLRYRQDGKLIEATITLKEVTE